MFCSNCGKEIDENVKFCSNCGAENIIQSTKVNIEENKVDEKKSKNKREKNINEWVSIFLSILGLVISFFPLWNIVFFIFIIFSLKQNIIVCSKKNKLFGTIGIIISIIAILVTLCMYLNFSEYKRVATIEGIEKKVSANMIKKEYSNNPIKAGDKYLGKKVNFIGTVESYDTYIPTPNDYRCVVAIKFKEGWYLEVPESGCDMTKLDKGTKLEITSIIQDLDGNRSSRIDVYDYTTRSERVVSETTVKLNGEDICK